ncbi:ABC transporter permease [Spirochaetia bacterium 38H-sp]|uniref:ABC transporter permease n=1 Tax=Rarispira pelagica TaxID=3141764 RepID=A0ABU9U9K9_9SPIR
MDIAIFNQVFDRAFLAATPLLLAILGEILTERAGILNLGLEGLMSVGAMAAFLTAMASGSAFLAITAAILTAMLLALVHGIFSVNMRGNQVVSGLAIAMIGSGLASVWGRPYIGRSIAAKMGPLKIPFLSDIPLLGAFFRQSIFFYIAILLAITLWLFLMRTRGGVILRSCGHNPRAAESQGIGVAKVRLLATIIGGGLSGLAGSQLVLSYSSSWTDNIVAGRGWIAVALTIFSLWSPLRAVWGAFLFGLIFVLQYVLQPLGISPSFLAMLPYLATLTILIIEGARRAQHHSHEPAMLGEPFSPGER